MFKTLLLSAVLSLALCACNTQPDTGEPETVPAQEPENTSLAGIELDTAGRPPSVVGCSCLLAGSVAQFRNEQFLYAEKYGSPTQDFAFIFVNGEPVRLTIQDFQIDNEAGTRKVIYTDDDYKVTVDLQARAGPDRESVVQTGTLTLESGDGKTLEKDVYGVCGC